MMRVEQAGTMWCQALGRHWTIGNPDAFMFAIHNPGLTLAGDFLGAGAGKKRSVKKCQSETVPSILDGAWSANVVPDPPPPEHPASVSAAAVLKAATMPIRRSSDRWL